MKTMILVLLSLLVLGGGLLAEEPAEEAPVIEIAILLDTSGSMQGLIKQARGKLWTIVNKLALTEKNGQIPDLRVALYEYGSGQVNAEDGFIRKIVPLTDDLDTISTELFALNTSGSSEYCGQVIHKAVNELQWTDGDHYKAIFIAGNEPFTQGDYPYADSCSEAIARGIIVNTLHCGSEAEGRQGKWDHGAALADGKFMNIDHNSESVAIEAPQDRKLAELSQEINKTYLAYGKQGQARMAQQAQLDEQADQANSTGAAQRAMTKGGNFYKNGSWDLVDGVNLEKMDLSKVKEEDLPEEMKGMSLEEKEAYVKKKLEERKAIQEEIQKLTDARNKYVAEERRKLAESGDETFDSAVQQVLETQLKTNGFKFKK
jgi:hypothetical protein